MYIYAYSFLGIIIYLGTRSRIFILQDSYLHLYPPPFATLAHWNWATQNTTVPLATLT